MTSTTPPEIAAHVESLVPQFRPTRLLNSDQAGRRIALLGTIQSKQAVLIAERAAFDTSAEAVDSFSTSLQNIKNLGANDIYAWFLANSQPSPAGEQKDGQGHARPDLKLNLIYPCTEKHIKKYEQQSLRIVTETPEIYQRYVRPYMQHQREKGVLNWVFNIIEGRTEQEDVMYRESGDEGIPTSARSELGSQDEEESALAWHSRTARYLERERSDHGHGGVDEAHARQDDCSDCGAVSGH